MPRDGATHRDVARRLAHNNRAAVERGFLAQALAERQVDGAPLVAPSLRQRLRDELPGSVLHDSGESWSPSRWKVLDRAIGRLLGAGASEREAVARAVVLWGRR